MSKYIDIESKEFTHLISNLEPRWKPMAEFNGEDFQELNSIAEAIFALPTADVVEVVRCKDCKESEICPDTLLWCNQFERLVPPNGFCHCGERKDDGT